MVGVPVIINHKEINNDNADDERVGVVNSVWYDEKDGWYWCDGIIWDETAQNLITDKDWSVSCSYDVKTADNAGGSENNIPYDMEFLDGVFTHLALVSNPRYERANIVFNSKDITLEQFAETFYDALTEVIVENCLGESIDNDKWITIKPHGKDAEDYKRLKLEDGESPKEGMKRVYGIDISKKGEKEEKKEEHKEQRVNKNKEIEKEPNKNVIGSDYDKLKTPQEKIDYLNKIDISTLDYKGLVEIEEKAQWIFDDKNIDITQRKEAQKILFKITDRKERQRAIEKAKEVGGYTEKLQQLANFSHFSDISSCSEELQKHIYDKYKKVYDKYPQLNKSGYGSLKIKDLRSSTYAENLSIVNSVTLNSSWYNSLDKLKKSYAEDVEKNWHPQGTDYNSVITHELGHGLLGYIQSNLGVSGKAIRAKVLKKQGLRIKDIDNHLSRYPNNSKSPIHEFFAEAFAEYVDSPNPRPLAVEFGKEIERILRDLG